MKVVKRSTVNYSRYRRQGFIRFLKSRGVTGRGFVENMNVIYKNLNSKMDGKDPLNTFSAVQHAAFDMAIHLIKMKVEEVDAKGNEHTGAWSRFVSETVGRTITKTLGDK